MEKEVSIIIPNYNRASIILETLKSVQNQTYRDWECIIVDDHSTDNSIEVISAYIKYDTRFRLVKRPESKPKGAGSCRNYGFDQSKGKFIKWFDSDDIMTSDHLSTLVEAIKSLKVDFVIGESLNFVEKKGVTGKPYGFDRSILPIDAYYFGIQAIGWITGDFLGKKTILENLRFNETFKTDGDEYNFFTQLLHENNNGKFVDRVLTYRRLHKNTLSYEGISETEFNHKTAVIKFLTFCDIEKYRNDKLLRWFLSGYMQYAFKLALVKNVPPYFIKSIIGINKYLGFLKATSFSISIFSGFTLGKGYKFLRKAIN